METELQELARALKEKLELDIPGSISEAEILLLLERKLGYLLEREPEAFFQALYRIDIPEQQLNAVLQRNDALQELARMVYERQLEKVRSRNRYRDYFNNTDADKELKW